MSGRVVKLPDGNYGIIEDHPGVRVEILGAQPVIEVTSDVDLKRLKKARNRAKLKKIIGDIVSGQES